MARKSRSDTYTPPVIASAAAVPRVSEIVNRAFHINNIMLLQGSQVNRLILQPIEIHAGAGSDERQHAPDVSRPVEPDCRVDPSVVDVTRKVIAGIQSPANDQLVPCRVKSDVLQVEVVLIGPEPRYLPYELR